MFSPAWDGVRRQWKWIAGAVWLVSGALYLTLPPCPDQFELGYMGWRILNGDVPYRDFVDMNWPGMLWLHTLSSALFGNHLWSWHLLDFLLLAVSGGFLADMVRRTAGPKAAFVALLLYPAYYVGQDSWIAGQSDMAAVKFLLGALWFHVRGYETRNWRWQAGTGVFLALAVLCKPTAGVLGVFLVAQALILREAPLKILLHATVAAGCSLVLIAGIFMLLLAQGVPMLRLWESLYSYNAVAQFFETTPVSDMVRQFFKVHCRWWHVFTVGGILGAGWGMLRKNRSVASTSLAALWITGILSFMLQRKGMTYHLSFCLPAAIGLTATAIGVCWNGRADEKEAGVRGRPWLAPMFTLIVLVATAIKLGGNYCALPAALFRGEWDRHWSRFDGGDYLTMAESIALARKLDAELLPGEPLFVVGHNSSMNYLTRRRQPTKFYYSGVLINLKPPLPMADPWSAEWEADLRQITTKKCLVARHVQPLLVESELRPARALRSFLEGYRRTATVGDQAMDIYERR